MRDYIISAIVFGALPVILMRPYIGVLLWSWIGYMNPHRLTWGFAYEFPFAAIVGAATLVSIFFSRDRKSVPWTPTTVVWLLFLLWITVTTLFAVFPEHAWPNWEKFMKIQVMTLITLLLIRTRERIQALVWVIVMSLGFFSVKGGLFAIRTGGQHLVWGPEDSFIADNNGLGFAIVMLIPLMRYLQLTTKNKWLMGGLTISMLLSAITVLASYSRGAFLAVVAIAMFMWLKSKKRALIGLIILISIPVLWSLMPEKWVDRVNTIQNYEEDESAMGRIYVWVLATKIAAEYPITGGGFGSFDTRHFHERYGQEIKGDSSVYIATNAHSIYFLVLGDHGYIGLALFILLWVAAFRMGGWIIRHTRELPEMEWARNLAAMIQVSLIGFAVGGAFIGRSYYDFYYHLIALLIVTRVIVAEQLVKK